ncbi:MAG: 1-deoxy-D-xylulose-5-phosphate reductoisomerase [Candidatus Brocadiae bacterium]|nr:1-deoxy-D-xylulose-5-phosphate reductoisomerase [Candidatus Brocadiia bacterium]
MKLPTRFLPLLLCALPAIGQDHLVRETEARSPEEELAAFTVAEGFEARLFAAEPMINKPINLAVDSRGRVWVSSTVEYPYAAPKVRWSDPRGARVEGSRDAIKILEDTDHDGRADRVTDFADGLNIPTGVLPWHRPGHHDGCIAWSIPNLWYFADTDGDGRADLREVLFGPLGYEKDTHGMISSLRPGPDGWIYATHGFNNTSLVRARDGSTLEMHSGNVFRFRPDGTRVEIWSRGQVNPFGLAFDRRGNLYSADCHSAPVYQLLHGASYPSFGKPHDGLGYGPGMIEHTHGSTGIAGIVYLDRGVWGPAFDDHLLIGNPVTSRDLHVALFTPTLGGRDGRVRQVDGAELGADGTARLWCDGGALDEARLRVGFGEAYREFSVAAARAAGSSGVLHLRIPSDFLGKVRVRVELPSRLPLRDARVVIEGTVRSYDLIAGADGVAAHPWVIAGSYRVSVLFGRDEPVVEADLVVVPGRETDIVLAAITGAAGLPSAVRAVSAGKRLALANKEALVMAGPLLTAGAVETGASIIPVDSEHSAIFQALRSGRPEEVHRIILTASGGPFRDWTAAQIAAATPEQALKHPTWQMGPKITIDSATMMNKALEVIEARWLFNLPVSRIAVAIHPQSIIHSLVEFHDASTIAQLGYPDMAVPIRYALTFPARARTAAGFLDLAKPHRLDLLPPDPGRFPALALGFDAAGRGGTAGAALNGANEASVALFLEGRIPFPAIAALNARALAEHPFTPSPGLDALLETDTWARTFVAREARVG